jgi:tape measure domain-containing protein
MADIATIGFKVDTKGLKRGEQALDNFAKKGEQTEKRINDSFKRISMRILGIKDVIGKVGLEFVELSSKTDATRKLVVKDMQQMRNGVKDLNREVKKVPVGFARVSRSAKVASASTSSSLTTIKKEVISIDRAVGLLATAFLFIGGIQVVSGLVAQSDAWKGINSQIRQVTNSQEDLIKTQKILFNLAKETRSELTNTVNLFAELSRGTSELGISSGRLVGVTRTLNNLFVAGGKPISETIGAIRQLNQGFASGVLRGDEFNSVAEGAPKIMTALTRSLGLTRGELREFAATGGITAQIMITALESFSREAQKLADQTQKTFAQSLQISTTNITKFVGEAELLNSVIGSVVFGMEDLSENLNATSDAAKTLVAVVGIGLTPIMFGYIKSLVGATVAQLTAGTTAIRTANAFGVVTTAAATTTVATNALGIATRFLLGPWGLLLTAIGAAVAVYSASKQASEEITKQFEIEEKAIEKLGKSYLKASVGRLGADYIKSQRKAIEIDRQRNKIQENIISIQNRIAAAEAVGGRFRDISPFIDQLKIQKEALSAVNLESEENARVLNVISDVFDNLLPKANEWGKVLSETTITLDAQLKAQLKIGEAFGNTIISLETQRQELLLGADAFEIYAAEMQAIADGATPAMVEAITNAIIVNQKLRKELKKTEDALSFEDLTSEVENFGGAWTATGSIIVDAFGGISDAINDNIKMMSALEKQQEKINQSRKAGKINDIQQLKLEQRLNIDKNIAELKGLGALSKASGSLFSEKTAAAKAFATLNKIIAVAEIALSFQKMAASTTEAGVHVANEGVKQGANALTAITSAFAAPFPINFVAGAAMIAIMAGLLGGSSGGGGAGFGESAAENAQKTQGTGTVFGSDDKSQSIINAQERFEDIAIDQLAELRGIRNSMTALSDGINKLAGTIVGGGLGEFAGPTGITSASLGGLLSKTTKTVVDEGVSFIAQSLGLIIDQGIISAQSFFDITTKKKRFFGLSSKTSTSTEFQNVDIAIRTEIGAIFGSIGDTVTESVRLLGLDTERSVNDFRVNIGRISFKDLTGEEIQAELQAVFSQQADLISTFLVPELRNFQQIGEGLFDTLIRVTQEQVIFNDVMDEMGSNLSDLSNIMQIEVAQSIIGLIGGLERFSDLTNKFFDEFFTQEEKFERLSKSLNEAVSGLGVSMFESRDQFRFVIEGMDKTTLAGQQLFAGLLELVPAFDDFFDAVEESEQTLINQRNKTIEETAKLAEAERRSALDSVRASFAMLQKSVALEKQRASAVLDVAKIANKEELDRISGLRSTLEAENAIRKAVLTDAEVALNKSFNAEISRIQDRASADIKAAQDVATEESRLIRDISSARIDSLNDEKSAINDTANAMRSLVQRINSSLGLTGGLDLISALAAAKAGDFSRAQALDISSLSNLDPAKFGSAVEFQIAQAVNLNRLATLGGLAGARLTEAEIQLQAIDSQIEAGNSNSEAQIFALELQSTKEIEAIQEQADRQIVELESQRNVLLGIDTSILDTSEAIVQFRNALVSSQELNFEKELGILDILIVSADEVFALHEQGYADELKRLDTLIESGEAVLNAALGIDNSVLSIAEAITGLNASLAAIPAAVVASNEAATIATKESNEAILQSINESLKDAQDENRELQMVIVRNSTTSARALQQFKLDGIETRAIE